MMFNTSKWFYNTTAYSVLLCPVLPAVQIQLQCQQKNWSIKRRNSILIKLLYDTHAMKTPDSNQQRVRILLWLKRMNYNVSQLQKLDDLRKIAVEKYSKS